MFYTDRIKMSTRVEKTIVLEGVGTSYYRTPRLWINLGLPPKLRADL
jgi:hypothetical protein